jgi:hypothetical protein
LGADYSGKWIVGGGILSHYVFFSGMNVLAGLLPDFSLKYGY